MPKGERSPQRKSPWDCHPGASPFLSQIPAFQDFQERLALTICQVKEPKSPSQETVLSFYLPPLPCYMRFSEGGEQGAWKRRRRQTCLFSYSWLIMHWWRNWSCTDHVADHALITWLSCTDHLAGHAMITQLPCTGHVTDHALMT